MLHSAVCAAVGVVILSNPGHEGWVRNIGESIGGCCVAWGQGRVLWVVPTGRGERSPVLTCRQTKVSESFFWPPGKAQLKVSDPARNCNISV